MSTVRSALDELRGEDLSLCSHGELEDRLVELRRVSGAVEAETARTVAEIERRGAYGGDGHLSLTSWVDSRLRTGWGEAARHVRLARSLQDMPVTRGALAEGEVSAAAVSTLVDAREDHPEEFSQVEEVLVDAARSLPLPQLRRAVEHWREAVAPEGAERHERERWERRRLHVSPTLAGMVRVDGDLDPEGGQGLITALRAVMDASVRSGEGEDPRTPAQRRADALGEVCRQWLDRSDRPTVGGERPHLTVTVDLPVLEARAGRTCELDDAGRVTAEAARRLACDASVSRVITRGGSVPLEVGRRTPVVSPGLRRAVVVRDGTCRFPGCGRPRSWCDAHHAVHWADGGETNLSNLVLLCRPHHRMVHQGFGVKMVDGEPAFVRPDGSQLEERGPP